MRAVGRREVALAPSLGTPDLDLVNYILPGLVVRAPRKHGYDSPFRICDHHSIAGDI